MNLQIAKSVAKYIKLLNATEVLKNGQSIAVLSEDTIKAINYLLINDTEFRTTFFNILNKIGNKYFNSYNEIISNY